MSCTLYSAHAVLQRLIATALYPSYSSPAVRMVGYLILQLAGRSESSALYSALFSCQRRDTEWIPLLRFSGREPFPLLSRNEVDLQNMSIYRREETRIRSSFKAVSGQN